MGGVRSYLPFLGREHDAADDEEDDKTFVGTPPPWSGATESGMDKGFSATSNPAGKGAPSSEDCHQESKDFNTVLRKEIFSSVAKGGKGKSGFSSESKGNEGAKGNGKRRARATTRTRTRTITRSKASEDKVDEQNVAKKVLDDNRWDMTGWKVRAADLGCLHCGGDL